jgi:hypothetical protein
MADPKNKDPDFTPDGTEDDVPQSPLPGIVSQNAASKGKEIVFVKHPCIPAVKKRIVNSGRQIVDAKFMPADWPAPVIDGQTGKKLTVKEQAAVKKSED